MSSIPASQSPEPSPLITVPRVIVATTAMLTFISFWRAAAIVLNDLASSAYYAGGESESFIGKSAPWFILGVMLFSYCVRAVYVESCSMFVRGGVYRVVKEALGGTLAKFSVSALMFDYVLTGPISGVSAGQYLAGLLNELFAYFHIGIALSENSTAAFFAVLVTLFFWWENIKGVHESSDKALKIMQVTTVMVVVLIVWCVYTIWIRGAQLPPFPTPANIQLDKRSLGWLYGHQIVRMIPMIAVFVCIGHSVLAMSGEESLAQVNREIEAPKLPNLKKAGLIIFFYLQPAFHFTRIVFRRHDHSGRRARQVSGEFDWRPVHEPRGPVSPATACLPCVCGRRGNADPGGRREHGHRGIERRAQSRFRRRRAGGLVPAAAPQIRHIQPHHQHRRLLPDRDDHCQPRRRDLPRQSVCVRCYLELYDARDCRARDPVYASRRSRIPRASGTFICSGREIPLGLALITVILFLIAVVNLFTKPSATIAGLIFSLIMFGVFTVSEKITHRNRGAAHVEMDQFNVAAQEELTRQSVGVRAGSVLVPVSNYHALYHLQAVLDRVRTERRDVVVMHVRLLRRAASGSSELEAEQVFGSVEQFLFTKALSIAEKRGKPIRLAVVSANDACVGRHPECRTW